jgi:hypothetical protein
VKYTTMLNEEGGIVDDMVIYKFSDTKFMVVGNGANHEKDFNWIKSHISGDCAFTDRTSDYAQMALQGPNSTEILGKLAAKSDIPPKYYTFLEGPVAGFSCIISQTGYTGEMGYELYTAPENAVQLWDALIDAGKDLGLDDFPSDAKGYRSSYFAVLLLDIPKRDGISEIGHMGSRGGKPNFFAVDGYFILFAYDAPACHFKTGEGSCACQSLFKRRFPDKAAFAELDAEAKVSLQRRDVVGHLMAVKGHPRLQPQGVARAEPAGDKAEIFAGVHERIPEGCGIFRSGIKLVAHLAGIAGPADNTREARGISLQKCVVLERNIVFRG